MNGSTRPGRRPLLAQRRRVLALGGALPLAACTATPPWADWGLPQVTAGRLERWPNLASKHVPARHVDVWLPPGYSPKRPHAVLYMHDGQMLFDPATTWNRQAWQVDAVAAPLLAAGRLREFIVVGVWNIPQRRRAEFFPRRALELIEPPARRQAFLQQGLGGQVLSDAYVRFLVEELKPAIDARYATRPGREDTFLMGSSMGGLISLDALLQHPEVFGGAAALSTHWIGTYERNPTIPAAMLEWLRQALPAPGRHRLYMDRGTATLDAQYDQAQPQVDALLRARGFAEPAFRTRVFEGADHTENAWRQRLHEPLAFLLGR